MMNEAAKRKSRLSWGMSKSSFVVIEITPKLIS